MDLHPDLKAPWVPDIGVRFVPEAEKRDAEAFYHNLYELQKWSDDFACSLALYDTCEGMPPGERGPTLLAMRWRFMAARNGGLALRNFSQCLAAARGVVGKVKFWNDKINLMELKAIEGDFRERFPDIDKLRHAVAHPELYANPSIDMSGGSGGSLPGLSIGEGVVVQDSLAFRTYATTINGMMVGYQLTIENAGLVVDLTRRAYAAVEQLVCEAANSADQIEPPIEGDLSEVGPKD
jgi:hypothetical protein